MWRFVTDVYGNVWKDFTPEKYAEFTRKGIPIASFNPTTLEYEPNEYFKMLLERGQIDYLVSRSEMEFRVKTMKV